MKLDLPPEMDATLVRVADSLYARKPHPLWGVVQAAIWIATQQLALVEMVRPHQPIRASSITEADLDLVRVLKEQPHLLPDQEPPLLGNAVLELWRACAEGKIVMSGHQRNADVPVVVPISAWAGVTIMDNRREGIIAASDDWQRLGVAWWGGLTLCRDDVVRLWPAQTLGNPSAPPPGSAVGIGAGSSFGDGRESTQPSEPCPVATLPQDNDLVQLTKEILSRRVSGDKPHDRDAMRLWIKREIRHMSSSDADALYHQVSKEIRRSRQQGRPSKQKSGRD